MEAFHSLWCRAGCARSCFTAFRAKARVAALHLRPTASTHGLSLLRQGAAETHKCRLETTRYGRQRDVDGNVKLLYALQTMPGLDP